MAATDARRIIKGAAYRVYFDLRDSTTEQLKSAVTGYAASVSKDGGTFAGVSDSTQHEVATTSGTYYIDLTATEMSADHIAVKITATSTRDRYIELRPEPFLHSGVLASATSTSVVLPSGASTTNDMYNGAVIELVRGTGAGQVRTITDYVGSTLTGTLDRAWATTPDSTTGYIIRPVMSAALETDIKSSANVAAINTNTAAAANLKLFYDGAFITGSIDDAGPTASAMKGNSALSATDDFYNDMTLVFTSGTLEGVARKVLDYTGSTKQFTFTAAPFPAAPANGDTFILVGYLP